MDNPNARLEFDDNIFDPSWVENVPMPDSEKRGNIYPVKVMISG
jgi:hypothetical protein